MKGDDDWLPERWHAVEVGAVRAEWRSRGLDRYADRVLRVLIAAFGEDEAG